MQSTHFSCQISYRFSKYTKIQNFMKILPIQAELLCAVEGVDMTKLIVANRNFANVPKNDLLYVSV